MVRIVLKKRRRLCLGIALAPNEQHAHLYFNSGSGEFNNCRRSKRCPMIGFVVVLNPIIDVIQEYRAEWAQDELKKISTPQTIVKRERVIKEIPSEEVVLVD